MTDVLIQFHAVSDEIAAFLKDVLGEFDVHLTALRFRPFSAAPVGEERIELAIHDAEVLEFALSIEPADCAVPDASAFASRNPSALRLSVGRLSERGLDESCLSVRTTDEKAVNVWKQVARKLRRITLAGAVATNPATGATSRLRSHRFTPGAKALDESGVVVRPVAGGTVLHLGDR